mmetsp:Transcript_119222/g.299817  ORF Transcript_119222/g.299817 Transcript_119222/m.299817 type:complete len:421 (+) Transcript_119222:2217-3479(+)
MDCFKGGPSVNLERGLALGDFKSLSHGNLLDASKPLKEDSLEFGERDRVISIRINMLEHRHPALRVESDLLTAEGLRQLLQPINELVLRNALRASGDIIEQALVRQSLFFHMVTQSSSQGPYTGRDQKFLAALFKQGGTCISGLLDLLVHACQSLACLRQEFLGGVPLLVSTGHLLMLGHLCFGLFDAILQVLECLSALCIAGHLLLPSSQETACIRQDCLGLLKPGYELLTLLIGNLSLSTLLRERFNSLGHLLHCSFCCTHFLTSLLHQSGLLPRFCILFELPELSGCRVDALRELRELLGGWLGSSLAKLLHFQIFRGDEVASCVDGGLHCCSRGFTHGNCACRLFHIQNLNALEVRQLCLVHFFHSGLNFVHFRLAFPNMRSAHHELPLILSQGHQLRNLRQGILAAGSKFLKRGL